MKKIICLLIALLIFSLGLTSCGLSVPRPEIKSGEFNFSVTYEYAGKTKTVSGVYVCEYDGVDWVLDGGYHREWKGYVKDGTTEECIVLGIAEDGGVVELNFGFDPDRFMGDEYYEDAPFAPYMTVRLEDDEGLAFENRVDYIYETYGARIINYEYDEPIENTFK